MISAKQITLFSLVLFFVLTGAIQYTANNQSQDVTSVESPIRSRVILDDIGEPTNRLLEFLALTRIDHNGTLRSIIEKTQQAWLRKPGKERWHMQECLEEQRDPLLASLVDLQCIQEIQPTQHEYDYALVLGCSVSRMRTRLAHLFNLYDRNIRFKKLVFLVGQRPLDPEIENAHALLDTKNSVLPTKKNWQLQDNLPTTETEMTRLVLDQAELPQGLEAVGVIFVDTPLQHDANGTLKRPTTGDTIIEWLKTKPIPGSCLFISNQPYVGYQDSVVRTYLPKEFSVETVGSAASNNTSVAVHLDNIARWLYQESKRLNN